MNKIQQDFLNPSKWSRPRTKLGKISGVVIHWVANPNSSAKGNRNFFNNRTGTYGSAHFIIGLDGEIIQCLPLNEMGYHVGSNTYSKNALNQLGSYPNASTVGIEFCHPDSTGKPNSKTYKSLVELSAKILKDNHLTEDDLWTHKQVVLWKNCPKFYVDNTNQWESFKNDVAKEMGRTGSVKPSIIESIKDSVLVQTDTNGQYVVKRGDTLWGISQAFDVTVAKLRELNPKIKGDVLNIGDKVNVGKSTVKPPTAPSKPAVSTGGVTYKIAKVTSDVWLHNEPDFNDSSRERVLKAGETYKMYGENNGMYNLGGGMFVSKKYIELSDVAKETIPTVKVGMSSTDVKKVQTILKAKGYKITVDGIFGNATLNAIKEFQRANGLTSDGIVGQNTWERLLREESFYGVATGDVWLHSKADLNASTRTTILTKGKRVEILDDANATMYKTNLGYVSKKYILKKLK